RAIQRDRFAEYGIDAVCNGQCSPSTIEKIVALDEPAIALLKNAAEAMQLSARGYHRVLKVARTLADLDASGPVGRIHLAEALSYRAIGDILAAAA
ncbi:MAG: ATP-binding protein, partial [Bauldia sp.]|nr:ATP-binding protein [Bauldia sp.]